MEEAKKVTATLKIVATGEFIDNEASEDTVRYFVEQYLENSGLDVEVELLKEQEAIRPELIMGTSICDCGKCKHAVAQGMNYCPVCGCRIDWN